jgi:hypothetical protein
MIKVLLSIVLDFSSPTQLLPRAVPVINVVEPKSRLKCLFLAQLRDRVPDLSDIITISSYTK